MSCLSLQELTAEEHAKLHAREVPQSMRPRVYDFRPWYERIWRRLFGRRGGMAFLRPTIQINSTENPSLTQKRQGVAWRTAARLW